MGTAHESEAKLNARSGGGGQRVHVVALQEGRLCDTAPTMMNKGL